MIRRLAALAMAGLLAACATVANYERILDGWLGWDLDALVQDWGPPQSSFKLKDGRTVYEWVRVRSYTEGGYTRPTVATARSRTIVDGKAVDQITTIYGTETTPTRQVINECRTRFTAEPSGRIVAWSHEGPGCVATDPGP